MQPYFTPAWQEKDSVNLLSILTADLSFEYMDIKTSKKRPWTPSFLSLSDSFCRGIQSKAFRKSTKREKSKFRCFCGMVDFMYLSISIFLMWRCYQLCHAFFWSHPVQLSKFLFGPYYLLTNALGVGGGGDRRVGNWLIRTNIRTWRRLNASPFPRIMGICFAFNSILIVNSLSHIIISKFLKMGSFVRLKCCSKVQLGNGNHR